MSEMDEMDELDDFNEIVGSFSASGTSRESFPTASPLEEDEGERSENEPSTAPHSSTP